MYDVIGVGACSIDFVYQLPATPLPDSPTAKLHITRHVVSPGGQTATVLCTCAALGSLRTAFVGTIGNDAHASTLVDALRARGVDTAHVIPRAAPSPYAVILVDEHHGERIVLWDRSAATALRPEDLARLDITSARMVFVDDVDAEAALYVAGRARRAGVRVVNDIEQVSPLTPRLIEAVDIVVFAEHVPQALRPGASLVDALHALRVRDDQWLCATRGARGAVLVAGGEHYSVSGHHVPVVDTTGAGDVFRGALITAHLRALPPGDVLAFANAAAAASCTTLGAIGGIPTENAVHRLLQSS